MLKHAPFSGSSPSASVENNPHHDPRKLRGGLSNYTYGNLLNIPYQQQQQLPVQKSSFAGTTVEEAIVAARADIRSILDRDINMAAKFVRLAFHDCIGGCDGCIDLSEAGHFGLEVPMEALEHVNAKYTAAGKIAAAAATSHGPAFGSWPRL